MVTVAPQSSTPRISPPGRARRLSPPDVISTWPTQYCRPEASTHRSSSLGGGTLAGMISGAVVAGGGGLSNGAGGAVSQIIGVTEGRNAQPATARATAAPVIGLASARSDPTVPSETSSSSRREGFH